ncbi:MULTISPECIES: DUF2214 family protein [Pseudoalteromonas]|uniref:DUF2214 family protein n=1 Tax=Pseudoalteromonas TaxID=53246 RepID=UPI000FFE7997|nr:MULTISPECIES: DUF2214 family protein [Pseudoalteromonas]NKC21207.1 DUF2214 family protein [Pseudoalteromonas galatheae]RXE86042.1 DUF2214 domain-containing protein [Pseudoalteromonas sp. A757]
MEEIAVRYIHFIGILFLASTLAIENMLLSKSMSSHSVKRLVLIDGLYGVSALVTLGAGLTLWFAVGKPSEFYTKNPIFHAKEGVFLLTALLSIIPTVFLLKYRNTTAANLSVPQRIIVIKRLEILLLLILSLLTALMARGYGILSS